MRVSAKGRYAVTSILELCLVKTDGTVALADIAEKQGISHSYLEQIFARLRKQGLVQGIRGPGGGYQLSRPTDEINITDILCAIDDTACSFEADDIVGEVGEDALSANQLWDLLSLEVRDFLKNITLKDLLEYKEGLGLKKS